MSLNKGQDPIPISYMMKLSHYYIHLNLIYQKSALTEYKKYDFDNILHFFKVKNRTCKHYVLTEIYIQKKKFKRK